ncbi:MAG: hypothetical protein DHS20C05_05000 [Hyphococcus sp.]|nr:MAG: hypothetical protein DHS20C05_05000 [Marinicaulis sp.]
MQFTVFYDGECPLCRREMSFYRKRRGADDIHWVDVAHHNAELDDTKLSRCDVLARFHIMNENGETYNGARAFAELWKRLRAFSWAGKLITLWPLSWVFERLYNFFLHFRPTVQRYAHKHLD